MDAKMLNILDDCPILPRSEIYYMAKDGDDFVFKQSNFEKSEITIGLFYIC